MMKRGIGSSITGVLDTIFPVFCVRCGDRLDVKTESAALCKECLDKIHGTIKHKVFYEVEERVAGILPLGEMLYSMLYRDNTAEKEIILRGKYGDEPFLFRSLAEAFGKRLRRDGYFRDVSCVVPVPASKFKKKKRGYNQTRFIAEGLAKVLEIELIDEVLLRRDDGGGTQTARSKEKRWQAMENLFYCKSEDDRLRGRRVLLVDDVLTTGATLVHAAKALFEESGVESISFYTLSVDI
ncbi:MAG: phosphoribosyltransferase family protein [Porphyromonas sp.]|nr:phosphoribosyltransferase family protein [Porphyromonas sp.]